MLIVTLPPAYDDLDPVVDRLVANYGDERRAQVEWAVLEAWRALRSIQDPVDRRVTAERLARIELHARAETTRHIGRTDDELGTGLPVQRTHAHGMWSVEPTVP